LSVLEDTIGVVHRLLVTDRRAHIIAERVAALLPEEATVLDIGCGNGIVSSLVMNLRPDVRISGVDIVVRDECRIEATVFNGCVIPLEADSVDAVLLIDVLHHTEDPNVLLAEAKRVARKAIVLKDHAVKGLLATPTLRFMEWFGNAPYGIVITNNFWTPEMWRDAFRFHGLEAEEFSERIGIYPWPASLLFDRSLHFLGHLIP
jgi:SAM-dependent methyltransferase